MRTVLIRRPYLLLVSMLVGASALLPLSTTTQADAACYLQVPPPYGTLPATVNDCAAMTIDLANWAYDEALETFYSICGSSQLSGTHRFTVTVLDHPVTVEYSNYDCQPTVKIYP